MKNKHKNTENNHKGAIADVALLYPNFKNFHNDHQFSSFLDYLPQCFGKPEFIKQCTNLWLSSVENVTSDEPLDEITAFLEKYEFTKQKIKIQSNTSPDEKNDALRDVSSLFTTRMPTAQDSCYYFPAGRAFNESFEEALGSSNPIPVIDRGLRAIFENKDSTSVKIEQIEMTSNLADLCESLIEWVAEKQDAEFQDYVRTTLQICFFIPGSYHNSWIEYGSVKSLLIALNTPEPLRSHALGLWGADLDYETDDRLLYGMGILIHFSFNSWIELDDGVKKCFADNGIYPNSWTRHPVPVAILIRIITCLYCRWLAGEDNAPDWGRKLNHLFLELDEIGIIDNEGRSPITASDAYILSHMLKLNAGGSEDLLGESAPLKSIFLALGRATVRDGTPSEDYFDALNYGSKTSLGDPTARFPVFVAFGRAAEKLGLFRLSAASMSFFLITQLVQFNGELKTEWSQLRMEIQRLLDGPGRDFIVKAITLAIEITEMYTVDINVMRFKEFEIKNEVLASYNKIESITNVYSDLRKNASNKLIKLIGESEWEVLSTDCQENLIDGCLQTKNLRKEMVHPEISSWGPIAQYFTIALECEIRHRIQPILDSPRVGQLFASFGHNWKPPKKWTFGAMITLLQRYPKYDTYHKEMIDASGLKRLCTIESSLLQRFAKIVELRNAAAHPKKGRNFTEADFMFLLQEIFTNGLLASYARSLEK